ncbi:MAG: glutamate 5-kinase [Cohaesibacteraceae bacterium]|nr:glutamate 5-kinase [Cohaesibacteraceae bacterium]
MRDLSAFRRIVIKIGSATLVDAKTGELRTKWLDSLAADIKGLTTNKTEILVVSSGAISLGRYRINLPSGSLKLEENQAAAAVGQIALAQAWTSSLAKHDLIAGQILLTRADTEERRRYLNARATISTLLGFDAIPIINENDTIATAEIRYGDNDRLAARVATMISADCLVLLSDIDGLYTAPPGKNPDAIHIPVVERLTPQIEAMAGNAGTENARGGMTTKIEAAKIATAAGTTMVIANGRDLHPLQNILDGGKCTWFTARSTPVTARKRWISGQLQIGGQIVVDAGAIGALKKGKSLLPAGIRSVSGSFKRGDLVSICGPDSEEIARGLTAYDREDAVKIAGRNSREIEAILGYSGRTELIHRDDLVMNDDQVDTADHLVTN